jgi:DNA-binding GntR family transcriptional regulator
VIFPAGVPRKRAVADALRREIQSGSRPPGSRFLSERDIQQTYDVGRDTAREAMRILAGEGLIVIRHGHPSRVADTRRMSVIPVPGPDWLIGARGATQAEADEWGVPVGSPTLCLVDRASLEQEHPVEFGAWPASRTLFDPSLDGPIPDTDT